MGSDDALQTKLIEAFHSSAIGGHSGLSVTYRRLKQLFAWHGMKAAVHSYVTSCAICQQAKPDRSRLPGLLQPLPVHDRAWSVVSMDFIEGLPSSGGASCILVVVDLFSKYAHFIASSIRLRLLLWFKHFSPTYTSFMGYLKPLSRIVIRFSPAHFGGNCSSLLESNCASTNAWRHSFVASFMHVPSSGYNGWIRLNCGTIQVGIQRSTAHHLRFCMVMVLDSSV